MHFRYHLKPIRSTYSIFQGTRTSLAGHYSSVIKLFTEKRTVLELDLEDTLPSVPGYPNSPCGGPCHVVMNRQRADGRTHNVGQAQGVVCWGPQGGPGLLFSCGEKREHVPAAV